MTEALRGRGAFAKYHALGNDYLVADAAHFGPMGAPEAIRLCERHRGIGSDGILLAVPSSAADLGLRIFNPDGSEAEKSGNGLRIFAHAAVAYGLCCTHTPSVEVGGQIVHCALQAPLDGVPHVQVEMGAASFASGDVAMTGPPRLVIGEVLPVTGEAAVTITAVSMGNPHCVVFTDALREADLHRLGSRLEHHPSFAHRTNVQLACVRDRHNIELLIWERGAGPTLASGSSSCAVAAAAVRLGYVEPVVALHMPGGTLAVRIGPDWQATLAGSVTPICTGTWLA